MLLIGLESSRSPHQCYFGHCFRCSSVQHTFVAVKPTSASFFSNLHALSPWGAPELLNFSETGRLAWPLGCLWNFNQIKSKTVRPFA
jgi:hypothetical protein